MALSSFISAFLAAYAILYNSLCQSGPSVCQADKILVEKLSKLPHCPSPPYATDDDVYTALFCPPFVLGDDENLNLYLEACIRLDLPACSPFVR